MLANFATFGILVSVGRGQAAPIAREGATHSGP